MSVPLSFDRKNVFWWHDRLSYSTPKERVQLIKTP